jgi:hypothetical protein
MREVDEIPDRYRTSHASALIVLRSACCEATDRLTRNGVSNRHQLCVD